MNAQTNSPPTITATGDQLYCPGNPIKIVTSMTITDSDDTGVEAMYVQIASGYRSNQDILTLTGTHPAIIAQWNTITGKLKLSGSGVSIPLYTELIAAILDIEFNTTNLNAIGSRDFSITIGDANYLPSSDHFYEYVPSIGITWTSAKTAAEGRTYFGLQGYLATIGSIEEAQLSGEQANGAGWIGGSDSVVEGVWKWMTGPESGTTFWNGLANGSTPNYANWNTGEPNQLGDEDYAHITAPGIGVAGSWNDLSNSGAPSGDYQPKGYIVEYGDMPGDPVLNISASTSIHIPTIITTTPDSSCGPTSIFLEATSDMGTIQWYDTASGGTLLGTGPTYTTTIINSTTTYYVAAVRDASCTTGLRTPVVATIHTIPTIITVTEDTVCFNGVGMLHATATTGSTVKWYDVATEGVALATGDMFTTPPINITTTYYVATSTSHCTTPTRVPVIAQVYSPLAPTGNTLQSFCEFENATVSSLNTVTGTNILWYATATSGTPYVGTELLVDGQTYYASQNDGICESIARLAVTVTLFDMVAPTTVLPLIVCDNTTFGSDIDGIVRFNLTDKTTELLNGNAVSDFTLTYFTDPSFTDQIIGNAITSYNNDPSLNDASGKQTIFVRIYNNLAINCFSESSFNLIVHSLPILNAPPYLLEQCDDDFDGFNIFNLTEINGDIVSTITTEVFRYFESEINAINDNNPITNYETYTNEIVNVDTTIWIRVENNFGCFRTAQLELVVKPSAIPTNFLENFYNCDDGIDTNDGISTFDFSTVTAQIEAIFPIDIDVFYYRNEADATSEINKITDPSAYENTNSPGTQEIWIRADSSLGNDCLGNGHHITLIVEPVPQFEVIPTAITCTNLPPITLSTFNPSGNYNYEWTDTSGTVIGTDASIDINSPGTYTVVANYLTNSGNYCFSDPRFVEVTESSIAEISFDDISIIDDSDNNTVSINNENNNLGIGDYEFSLDNESGPYQEEAFFEQVAPGIHTIYVRDKFNCGIESIEISVVGFPKFFTPNNDGRNDTWQILGVNGNFYTSSLIYIYDRFGKILTKLNPTSDGWNGYYNGRMLPSDDYWFAVILVDKDGNDRERIGHFSMIRR